jgi:TolA-binding protein
MAFLRQSFLILFALVLGGGQVIAASARENRDYAAAAAAFQVGMFGRADTAFAQFLEKYPESARVAEATLLQAQAEIKLGEFTNASAKLTGTNNLAKAGSLADEYVYWTGEAQFEGTNYSGAAQTWIALAQQFPESRRRLQAVVGAASALTALAEWQQVVTLLDEANGIFQRAAKREPGDEQVAHGELLLAQAKFALKDFSGASAILNPLLDLKTLKPELGRQGALLLYQVKMAAGKTDAALAVTTNLLQIARHETNADWLAEGTALRAGALEKLGRVDEAIAAYQENLTNAPVAREREAVLKIAGLAIAQNKFPVATNALENFLAQFPDSPAADVALLTLGELHLKNYAAQPESATNDLPAAQSRFGQFIGAFTNSPLLGKAYLDRGWCFWLAGKKQESFDDFKMAAQKIAAQQLPPSEDLLVAWFKMGDAQFAQKDFAGALENYRAVLGNLETSPETGASLGDRALYQSLRASLELKDTAGATNALAQIFKKYPLGELAQSSSLLYGESIASPADARALFEKVAAQLAGSPLQPQIGLAVARTYEREQNWPAAITNYANWLGNFPTNGLRAQASYSLAWSDFHAGNEADAFVQFTNFTAQFPANELAPLAQWWVADHFFRAGDFVDAERNYKFIFQNADWQSSPLIYPAQMMAGRAAVARLDYTGAVRDYFAKLEQDTNCPLDLRVQATFAHGDALMRSDSADTNNPLANFGQATNEFFQIVQLYPTNELGALALFYLGECNAQLGNFDAATNVYAQIFNSSFAGVSARSQAQIGFGIALEKKAAQLTGSGQSALLNAALDNYLAVYNGSNLRDGELSDPFWLKKAGLQAAPLVGLLNNPAAERNFYGSLKALLPQLAESLEKKIAALPPGAN